MPPQKNTLRGAFVGLKPRSLPVRPDGAVSPAVHHAVDEKNTLGRAVVTAPGLDLDVVPPEPEHLYDRWIHGVLYTQRAALTARGEGEDPGLFNGLIHVHAEVDYIHDDLGDSCDYPHCPGGPEGHEGLSVRVENY